MSRQTGPSGDRKAIEMKALEGLREEIDKILESKGACRLTITVKGARNEFQECHIQIERPKPEPAVTIWHNLELRAS